MFITFAEDFTTTTQLDSQLMGASDSGLYWNRGVHPVVTIDNLISLLPSIQFTFNTWDAGTTYTAFETSRKRSDIVVKDGKIYQSLTAANVGNDPASDATNWLETNEESVKVKSFIWSVEDNVLSALKLNRQLIENQYIYNVGRTAQTLTGDYSGWTFEPKGSDYVKIRINEMALQANTTNPVTVSVINQGQVVKTITLNPNNGVLSFEDVDYTIYGKGRFDFVFESQEVLSENAYNDPLKYDGFVCYPISGSGATPEGSEYTRTSIGNGLNFNVTVYLDSTEYVLNNKVDLAKFYVSQFEMDVVRMIVYNSNVESNRNQRVLGDDRTLALLSLESQDASLSTVAKTYERELKVAKDAIRKTFDRFIRPNRGAKFTVKRSVL